MRDVYHPPREQLSLSAVLYALSDPIRLRIVQLIDANGEQACGTFALPLAKPTLSHHLKTLREAGVIQIRLEGTQRLNSLRRADLDNRFPGLLDAVLHASAAQPTFSGARS
jgi:DNA-binding transcriptional ArsR family regulator